MQFVQEELESQKTWKTKVVNWLKPGLVFFIAQSELCQPLPRISGICQCVKVQIMQNACSILLLLAVLAPGFSAYVQPPAHDRIADLLLVNMLGSKSCLTQRSTHQQVVFWQFLPNLRKSFLASLQSVPCFCSHQPDLHS